MHWLQLALLAVTAVLECGSSVTPVAGKCRTFNINPTKMDFSGLGNLRDWEIIYATDGAPYPNVDHEFRYATPISGRYYRVDDVRTLLNGSTNQYTFVAFIVDNMIAEESVDENGVRHLFRLYTLAQSVDLAVLYYRCSDDGDPNLDTRIIEIPKGKKISEHGLKYLLEEDKKYNFKDDLKPLPKAIVEQDQ